jgi:hypothetical protein
MTQSSSLTVDEQRRAAARRPAMLRLRRGARRQKSARAAELPRARRSASRRISVLENTAPFPQQLVMRQANTIPDFGLSFVRGSVRSCAPEMRRALAALGNGRRHFA